jgi:hypothetical protein
MRYRIKEVIRQQKKSGLEVESSFFWRPNRGSIAVIDNHSEDRFGSGNVVSRTVQLLPDYPRYRTYCGVVPTDAKGAERPASPGKISLVLSICPSRSSVIDIGSSPNEAYSAELPGWLLNWREFWSSTV